MIVRTFMARMARLVKDGFKHQTVRPWPKRLPKPGEIFSGRAWIGKPYRSKQLVLVVAPIQRLQAIRIQARCLDALWVCNTPLQIALGQVVRGKPRNFQWLSDSDAEQFARNDGFRDCRDMKQEFERMGELPLKNGLVIYW